RPMDIAPIDAEELLSRAVIEMAGQARATGVHLEVAPSTGRVLVDADRIVQTLTNLLNNAIKFSTAGQRVVLDATAYDGQVTFRVRDEGRGIPADKLESVFQRFEQVDSSDARQKGGTGLGLAISRGIVEGHGGRIWAESRPGSGATVAFTLPAASRRGPSHHAPHQPGADHRTGGGTVLLVADDDDLADVLTRLLTGHGVPVVRAVGAGDAARVARESQPRLVVLDLDLEQASGSGYAVVSELRRGPDTAALDLIVYSTAEVEPADQPLLMLGRTDFVTKGRVHPVDLERRVLERLEPADNPTGGTTP
ncbi:MAG TPA: ATP-binding protein, partial [Nocardioides sp.]|nr:ATP-binding protein [Nocardioides sp.]